MDIADRAFLRVATIGWQWLTPVASRRLEQPNRSTQRQVSPFGRLIVPIRVTKPKMPIEDLGATSPAGQSVGYGKNWGFA
jgi:hypothetical protein